MQEASKINYYRLSARILSLVWVIWWMWSGLANAIGADHSHLLFMRGIALVGLAFLASALVAWRWERVGGIILIIEGVLLIPVGLLCWQSFPGVLYYAIMPLRLVLPLVAGILFLKADREGRLPLTPSPSPPCGEGESA